VRFGPWFVRNLNRAGSFRATARELARYKLDLVYVQHVNWDGEGTVRAGDYNYLYGKKMTIINSEQVSLYTTE